MHLVFTIAFVTLLSLTSRAQSTGQQPAPVVYSASSGWQKVTFRQTSRLPVSQPVSGPATPARQPAGQPNNRMETAPDVKANEAAPAPVIASPIPAAGYRPAFTGDFVTNRNRWKAGNMGDYQYQIGLGAYSIRKRKANTQRAAFSSVPLPATINLNGSEVFTIKVDMLADSGQVPAGGLLFGVKDSLNFCSFTLNARGDVSIRREANGQTFSDYMPGDFFMPGGTG